MADAVAKPAAARSAVARIEYVEPSIDTIIKKEKRGAVVILTLDNPDSRNSLSSAMVTALQQAIRATTARKEVRAIIIAANGPAFSSGHDLKELHVRRKDPDGGRSNFIKMMNACSALMQSIIKCPKPVIAAVEGVATAAGCQLVATCDLAIAGEKAQFATPGVDIGLFCSTPMVGLTRNVPRKKAMEMLMLGEMVSAREAAAMGLVNRVVPAGRALAEAEAMAEKIASKSPLTIAVGKEAYYAQIEVPLTAAYTYASEVMVHNLMAADAEEGIAAFLYKRPAHWEGN